MGHTQKKRFIDKEIYQKSTYGSDVPSETYPSPFPSRNIQNLLNPTSSPSQGRHLWIVPYLLASLNVFSGMELSAGEELSTELSTEFFSIFLILFLFARFFKIRHSLFPAFALDTMKIRQTNNQTENDNHNLERVSSFLY